MKKVVASVVGVIVVGVIIITASHHSKPVVQTVQPKGSYVALGDSVAAGVGLKDDSDSSACDRTNQSYPNKVATALHYSLTNLACSGASLPNGILGSQNVNNLMAKPQLEQLFALPKPNLITVTIGANDAKWTDIIGKCYVSECGSTSDTAQVTASLTTVTTNLKSLLAQLQTHYGATPPMVVVTGYHQVFPDTDKTCSDLTGIDASELAWGRQLQSNISVAVQTAVSGFNFVTFAPVDFTIHELCTTDSWVQGIQDKEPYHPTDAGQSAFAQSVIRATKATK